MKIVQPEVHIENQDWKKVLQNIEVKGRVCYKSEERISNDTANKFVQSLINRGHLSVLEHSNISVKFVCDRGVSHEIVRHRLASYSQESTRYCNYGDEKARINEGIRVIKPFFFEDHSLQDVAWRNAMIDAESGYNALLELGATPQEARSVLPNSLKTEIWMTANIREWLHFCTLRAAKTAHPQMKQIAIPLLLKMQELLPPIFSGMGYDEDFPKEHYAKVICG